MHTFSETGAGVPAFLAKLWRLVDDPETNNLICWSKDGRSFIIQNQAQFARELLPLNYKHNNMASFIRQLNMYGFHKITSIDNGGLKFDRDEMEFSHPCFKRNCPYLLEHIKRKIANAKSMDDKTSLKPEAVSKVLQDVKVMRGRQDSLDSRFSVMKQENEALWREIASLRQKHAKQQQIVNKLIQFLITIVQPSRNMTSVKRHMQLMINDTPENAKMRKTSESESDCGPVIHELGEELLDEVAGVDGELIDPTSPYAKTTSDHDNNESPTPTHLERPHSNIGLMSSNFDYSNHSVEDALNAVNVLPSNTGKEVSGMSMPKSSRNIGSSIIQSVNPDGSQILYHVTEVPDAQPHETVTVTPPNYNEDNVLTTPMVREQMARSQMLKQKNKQRRSKQTSNTDGAASTSPVAKVPRTRQQMANMAAAASQQQNNDQVRVKSEEDIDPMMFLNVYPNNRVITPDPQLISPNISEDSLQSGINVGAGGLVGNMSSTNDQAIMGKTTDLYNPNDFIPTEMPTDIFEDSSMIVGDNSNFSSDNFKLNQQQEYGRSAANSGKFSSFIARNNNGASTSAAAAAAAAAGGSGGGGDDIDSSTLPLNDNLTTSANGSSTASNNTANRSSTKGKNGNNMAVAKFKNEEILRDEVHGHLENVQDELESLKDILRGDGYSLDANTLMGQGTTSSNSAATSLNNNNTYNNNNNRFCLSQALDGDFFTKLFNDSDILGPYGLTFPSDASNDKKGSELMTYQPIYDLSDIIDINEKANLDGDAGTSDVPSTSRQIQQSGTGASSVLNTPYHE